MKTTITPPWLWFMTACLAVLVVLIAPRERAEAAETAPAAQELTRLLNEFLAGASRNDVAAHERFWADDLIYTRSAGVRMGKAEILDNARLGPHAAAEVPTQYSADEIRIQQYGDTAVVAFRLIGTMGSGSDAVVTHFLNTGTFVQRDGEWRAVAWQSTRVPDPREESSSNETMRSLADAQRA